MTDSVPTTPRRVTPRLLTRMTLAGATLGLAVAGGAPFAEAGGPALAGPERLWLATSDGGEGGEGGEGGAVAAADPAIGLLSQLGQVEGHLRIARALYVPGAPGDAPMHAGHPQMELYAAMRDQLDAIGAPQFDADLDRLTAAMKADKPADEVDADLARALARIDAARAIAGGDDKDELSAIVLTLRIAAAEYGTGVVDGKVAAVTEYRDAWGFVQAAKRQAERVAQSGDPKAAAAGKKTVAALGGLDAALPGVAPSGSVPGDAGMFLAAAATVEFAASGLK